MPNDELKDMLELKALLAVIGTRFISATPPHVLAVLWSHFSNQRQSDWLPIWAQSAKNFDDWWCGKRNPPE